jgi:mannose-1-phosphate guanylyltransferase/mannose-6-phosphate isomerase
MRSIILCGGSGTRLWPLSRKNYPKQFLKLYNDHSLLQETYLRMREIMPSKNIFVLTNEDNYFNALNQIGEVDNKFSKKNIIVEPASLNTAPAIAYAVKHLMEREKINHDEPLVFLPSDHFIGNKKNFLKIIRKALLKVGNHIGTIGLVPKSPETSYGYIKKGEKVGDYFKVSEFKEKPDKKTAEKYLASEKYLWNAGIYLFNAKTFVQELEKHAPEIYKFFIKKWDISIKEFSLMPSISIDFAISEKTDKAIVFSGDFDWSDIGSFDSLAEMLEKNGQKNHKHVGVDSKNIFVHSSSDKLVTTIGVDDLVIVENNDSILIQKRGKGEDVKKLVEHLKKNNFREVEHNIIVHRPWGKYEILIDYPGYKVKKITVYPKSKLSLQLHKCRSEHWVVVKGNAKATKGSENILLKKNESVFIPVKTKHCLENLGKTDLEIIEVQVGNYLEEDDIVRFDDDYKRT